MAAPWAAREAMSCPAGTGVRPAMRVTITVWFTPGIVYSTCSAAAAPERLETPGATS